MEYILGFFSGGALISIILIFLVKTFEKERLRIYWEAYKQGKFDKEMDATQKGGN